jgi:putative Holliday junction resolvase
MRYVGVDFGLKRIGLAISDASATLARPWKTVAAGPSVERAVSDLATILASEAAEDGAGIAGVVVGLPRRLGGEDSDLTVAARDFAHRVAALTGLQVHLQDERLTSHAAEERLAELEPDWRRRKGKLDAAAAAILLQDFLDALPRPAPAAAGVDSDSDD